MPQNPFPFFDGLGALRHAAQTFLQRGGFAVHFLQAERVMLQVQMRVGETGQDDASAEVEFLGAGIEQFIPTDRDDLAALNQQRGSRLLRRV